MMCLSAFDTSQPPGIQAYLTHCASCRLPDGKGLPGAVLALAGNGAVLAQGPQNVISVILGGLRHRTAMRRCQRSASA